MQKENDYVCKGKMLPYPVKYFMKAQFILKKENLNYSKSNFIILNKILLLTLYKI